MVNRKVYGLLGLAEKAGKVAAGEFSCEKQLQSGKARLVLLAADASENSKKKFRDKAAFRSLPCLELDSKEELGRTIGKQERTCAVVLDAGFAAAIQKAYSAETSGPTEEAVKG